MNEKDRNIWQSEVLNAVLAAISKSEELRDALVFKGARILNLRLGEASRLSLDIDSNLCDGFVISTASPQARLEKLRSGIDVALRRHFTHQSPARYRVEGVDGRLLPPDGNHPFGWSGGKILIRLSDLKLQGVRSLPTTEIDFAAPEKLGPTAKSSLLIQGGGEIMAYTLERIAGEKLRAFLSSLPRYREKIGRRRDTARVKDLFDLERIVRRKPFSDEPFWLAAGNEFRLACESRCVDCQGKDEFWQEELQVKEAYDRTLPSDKPAFETVKAVINEAVDFFMAKGIVPFAFPLPTDRR